MSQPIRWVLSVDEETVAIAARWQRKFSPLTDGNRSSLVRLLLKLWDRAATDERLIPLLSALQGLKLNNFEQMEIEFPAPAYSEGTPAGKRPPVRVSPSRDGARIGGKVVSRRMASEAYKAPFLNKIGPIYFSRCAA